MRHIVSACYLSAALVAGQINVASADEGLLQRCTY